VNLNNSLLIAIQSEYVVFVMSVDDDVWTLVHFTANWHAHASVLPTTPPSGPRAV